MVKAISQNVNTTTATIPQDQAKLEKACSEFEAIFINYMLKSMRTSFSEDGLLGNNNEGRIIRSMFDENLALGMAKGKGIGLGKMLFESLKA